MTPIDLGSYKSIYLQTAKEYINSLLAGCAKLASDSQDKEALNNLHIASHSLKTQSQVMGFINMASLSGVIEKISSLTLESGNKINSNSITVLRESVEALNLCFAQIEKENTEKDLSAIIKKLGNPSLRQV